jgi:NAD-dependent dihydropyrimidine dehydrogenase PreA subunit
MIDTGIEVLTKAGMPEEHIYFDKFEDTSSPAPAIDNAKCVLCDECLFVKPTENCIVEISALHKDDAGNIVGYDRVDPAHTSGLYYNSLFIDENECIRCGACVEACPAKAISVDNIRTPKVLRNNLIKKG